jgi:hypothetical protein
MGEENKKPLAPLNQQKNRVSEGTPGTPTIATQYGFRTKSIVSDGQCLCRAIADQLQNNLKLDLPKGFAPCKVLRRIAADHIISNPMLYKNYCIYDRYDVAIDEILVLARALQLTIVMIVDPYNSEESVGGGSAIQKPKSSQGTIYLYYKNRDHYESLYQDPTIKATIPILPENTGERFPDNIFVYDTMPDSLRESQVLNLNGYADLEPVLKEWPADISFSSAADFDLKKLLASTSIAMGEENKKPLAPLNQQKNHVSEGTPGTPVGLAVTALFILPSVLHSVIYDYVGGAEYLKLLALNTNEANEEELRSYSMAIDSFVFDGDKWRKYYGEVGEEPPIPKNLLDLYGQDCKLWKCHQERRQYFHGYGCNLWKCQKVYDTHLLTLIPATVNGTPLTLDSFKKLIQHPKEGGHSTKIRVDDDCDRQPAGPSHWALIAREVVATTRYKSWADQEILLAERAETLGIPYTLVPILTGVVSTACHHAETGTKLFQRNLSRASELIENNGELLGAYFCYAFGDDDYELFVFFGSESESPYGMSAFLR